MPAWLGRLAELIERTEGGPVESLETHISWVLLAGKHAYKLKKPVNFGFLDFSTLERRKTFCEEELRLNGRLAPQLYLRTVAITGTPESPQLDGEGPAWEYAVVMARFDQSQLLSRVLAEGRLPIDLMKGLADELVRFHAMAPTAPDETPFGRAEAVRVPVEENLQALSRAPLSTDERSLLTEIGEWCAREHSRLATVFESRRQCGRIRECHGDLHLGNMVLQDDHIVIFDGIEFSEPLRWIDVASELAFCVMDLEDRGEPSFAHRLLNRYLEQSGDYDLLQVLPYYMVYRATVRAKVAELRRSQDGVLATEAEQLQNERTQYLHLAWRWTQPRPRWLGLTMGVSGSGKTCGTQPLIDALGAIRIRSDVERKRLFDREAETTTAASDLRELYSARATERTYERLATLAEAALAAGFPVIVDATFLREADRRRFLELGGAVGVPVAILEFTASEAELIRRVAERRGDASDATGEVVRAQLRAVEPISPDERQSCSVLDGNGTEVAGYLSRTVNSHGAAPPV